jgi:predicted lipid-binding transport protein (Tim44 family)
MFSQVLELVIFAGLAAVVLFMLYSVLGRRVGRQPQDGFGPVRLKLAENRVARPPEEVAIEVQHPGLAAIKARDPGFELAKFLDSAKGAYQDIVRAFVGGDRVKLQAMTAPEVYDAWESAIAGREAAGAVESVEFVHPPRADLEDADVTGALAKLKVRFLAELRSRSTRGGEEKVDERRTAEIWTFERPLDSRDSGWTLARVDPAEA